MDEHIFRFFQRQQIVISELQYLIHKEKQTCIYTTDGREISTFIPLKDIFSALPENEFWNIQKGIVVAARYVLSIDDNGIYTMVDGTVFKGRQRSMEEHRQHRRNLDLIQRESKHYLPLTLYEKCALMDNAPIAFCIIELVFAENQRGVDFIFRYCNKMMEDVEGLPVSEMIDRSFYEVFKNGDKKWIIPYADVALNGVQRELRDYSPEIGKDLIIHCFQPEPGFCACFLIVDKHNNT